MSSTREILDLARAVGLSIERGKKHHKIKTPDGRMVAVVPTHKVRERGRQQDNVKAAIRRAGRSIE